MEEKKSLDGEMQVVAFTIGGEEYGLEVDQVKAIIRPLPITRMPRAPERVEGVINLKGNVVPVINLHKRLAIGQRLYSEQSRIIIVHRAEITAGIAVDSVKEVFTFSRRNIESPAQVGMADIPYLVGIGKIEGRIILVLDLGNLLGLA